MKPLKQKISFTLDEDVIEQIRFKAELDERSLSQYVNLILKEHLKTKHPEKFAKNFVEPADK